MRALCMTLVAAILVPGLAAAQEEAEKAGANAVSTLIDLGTDEKWLKTFAIEPKLLDAKDGAEPSLGLSYKILSRPIIKDWTPDAPIGEPLPAVSKSIGSLEFAARGTYASDEIVNTENAVDATAAGAWNWGLYRSNVASKTAFAAGYEQQQGNDKSAWRLEAAQTVGTVVQRLQHSHLIGRGAYARVDPIKDEARKAVLAAEPEPYDRVELELLAIVPLNIGSLEKMELRFLGFKELGAPTEVESAGLDESKLWSVYFALPNNMFVAYSKGGVPADRQDAKVLQIGWSSRGF